MGGGESIALQRLRFALNVTTVEFQLIPDRLSQKLVECALVDVFNE